MARSVFLLLYPSPVFPAHWALWIPTKENNKIGKLINVIGDPATGFEHEIQRRYDLADVTQAYNLVPLDDAVKDQYVSDDGPDALEEKAFALSPPVKSLVSSSGSDGVRKRVQIKNCQTWLRDLVDNLVSAGILHETSAQTITTAPMN